MGDATITVPRWRNVEVGRIVLFSAPSQYENRIAVIVEIHDAKRVIVDNPSEDAKQAVPRHSAPLSHIALTPLTIQGLPRAIGHAALKKKWEKAEIESNWKKGSFAQAKAKSAKRRGLNDFERFKVLRAQKQRSFAIKREFAKVRAAAK